MYLDINKKPLELGKDYRYGFDNTNGYFFVPISDSVTLKRDFPFLLDMDGDFLIPGEKYLFSRNDIINQNLFLKVKEDKPKLESKFLDCNDKELIYDQDYRYGKNGFVPHIKTQTIDKVKLEPLGKLPTEYLCDSIPSEKEYALKDKILNAINEQEKQQPEKVRVGYGTHFEWQTLDGKVCQAPDEVNHPSHYTDGKIEVIDFIEDKNLDYKLGNAVKYICRQGKKSKTTWKQDLEKAIWYINRYIKVNSIKLLILAILSLSLTNCVTDSDTEQSSSDIKPIQYHSDSLYFFAHDTIIVQSEYIKLRDDISLDKYEYYINDVKIDNQLFERVNNDYLKLISGHIIIKNYSARNKYKLILHYRD